MKRDGNPGDPQNEIEEWILSTDIGTTKVAPPKVAVTGTPTVRNSNSKGEKIFRERKF